MLAVRELRYQPNADARELSGKRSRIIGLIYENAEEFSYLNDVFNGALGICEPAGYRRALKQHGVAYAPGMTRHVESNTCARTSRQGCSKSPTARKCGLSRPFLRL